MSDDDVIDFLVMEAIYAKVVHEDKAAMDQAKVSDWKQGHNDLRQKLGQTPA